MTVFMKTEEIKALAIDSVRLGVQNGSIDEEALHDEEFLDNLTGNFKMNLDIYEKDEALSVAMAESLLIYGYDIEETCSLVIACYDDEGKRKFVQMKDDKSDEMQALVDDISDATAFYTKHDAETIRTALDDILKENCVIEIANEKDNITYPDDKPFWAEKHKWANLHFALYYNFVDGNVGHYDSRRSPEIASVSDEKIKEMCGNIVRCTCDPAEFFAKYDFSPLGLDNEVNSLKEELSYKPKADRTAERKEERE